MSCKKNHKCSQCGGNVSQTKVKICIKCKKENALKRKLPSVCNQCGKVEILLGKKRICQKCTHKNYYVIHREEVSCKTSKYQREKVRIKRGLPLDHPRLIAEFGTGYLSKRDGYRYLNKIGHPNAKQSINDIKNKRARIAEHVFVMSEYLKRPLTKNERVHHKNGIRDDNRIENLELWDTSHPSGQRVDDKIKWCKSFLKKYGYKVIKDERNNNSI